MTKYRLLRDLPFMNKGEIFDDAEAPVLTISGVHFDEKSPNIQRTETASLYSNLPDWFEKIEEHNEGRLKDYFRINSQMQIVSAPDNGSPKSDRMFEVGNYFKTTELAEAARDQILIFLDMYREHNQGKCDCAKDGQSNEGSSMEDFLNDVETKVKEALGIKES
ncbi:MAG TPA: hypothetical protein VJ841_03440 [Candidatus Saccharimonadales bacterium]|nr:hypothetical protein [Candidatus Saccharimonadales bacterium]